VIEPLHVGVAGAAANHQTPWRAMLDRERLSVEFVANQTARRIAKRNRHDPLARSEDVHGLMLA